MADKCYVQRPTKTNRIVFAQSLWTFKGTLAIHHLYPA